MLGEINIIECLPYILFEITTVGHTPGKRDKFRSRQWDMCKWVKNCVLSYLNEQLVQTKPLDQYESGTKMLKDTNRNLGVQI